MTCIIPNNLIKNKLLCFSIVCPSVSISLDLQNKNSNAFLDCVQSYQKALKANPSYKLASECLAIVLTDLGTSLKLAGNTQEGIQKYLEALKIDEDYAVKFQFCLFDLLPLFFLGLSFSILSYLFFFYIFSAACILQPWCSLL